MCRYFMVNTITSQCVRPVLCTQLALDLVIIIVVLIQGEHVLLLNQIRDSAWGHKFVFACIRAFNFD